jgi:hypothetical protein
MLFTLCKPPHARRNYVHRRAFKSIFKHQPKEVPFRYYLTSEEVRDAYGIDREEQLRWTASWKRNGFQHGTGPRPFPQGDGTYRFLWDEVTNAQPGEEWLDIFKRNRKEFVEADEVKARARSASA